MTQKLLGLVSTTFVNFSTQKKQRQIGDGTNTQRNTPTESTVFGQNLFEVIPGRYFTFLITKDGTTSCIGVNNVFFKRLTF
jgi:alpha-tubulin suppressor-like RCC1 family protein